MTAKGEMKVRALRLEKNCWAVVDSKGRILQDEGKLAMFAGKKAAVEVAAEFEGPEGVKGVSGIKVVKVLLTREGVA